jgi:hypothetical protein
MQEIRSWQAHLWPVLSITVLGPLVFTLGQDGSIRGWPSVPSLPPTLMQSYQVGLAPPLLLSVVKHVRTF